MAIAFLAAGAATGAAAAVSPLTPGVPAGLVAEDISILVVEIKGATAGVAPTITTPTGWTLIGTVTNNGTLVAGTDTGSNTIGMYYRVGTYSGPSITTTGGNSAAAAIVAYRSSYTGNGVTWDVSSTTTGSDTTSGANGSITGGADISSAAGDFVVIGAGLSGDIGTVTAQSYSATGGTFGTLQSRVNAAITTGADSRLLISDIPQTAGTTSAAPTYTYTNSSSTTSHARILRLRDTAPSASASKMSTLSDTFAGSSFDSKWSGTGTMDATVSGGTAHFPADTYGDDHAVWSTNTYDLISSEVVVDVSNLPSTTSVDGPFFTIELAPTEPPDPTYSLWYIRWFYYASGPGVGEWTPNYKNTGAEQSTFAITSGASTKYLRIKHDGTNIIWSYSSDGTSWTDAWSVAASTVAMPYANLRLALRAGSGGATTGDFEVNAVNPSAGTTQSASAASTPSVTLAGAVVAIHEGLAALSVTATGLSAGTVTEAVWTADAPATATATLSSAAVLAREGSGASTVTAALSASADVLHPVVNDGLAALTVTGSTSSSASPERAGLAAQAVTVTLASDGGVTHEATAALAVVAGRLAAADRGVTAAASLAVTANRAAADTHVVQATATLDAATIASGDVEGVVGAKEGVGDLGVTAALSGTVSRTSERSATRAVTVTLASVPSRVNQATSTRSVTATAAAAAVGVHEATGSLGVTAAATGTTDLAQEAAAVLTVVETGGSSPAIPRDATAPQTVVVTGAATAEQVRHVVGSSTLEATLAAQAEVVRASRAALDVTAGLGVVAFHSASVEAVLALHVVLKAFTPTDQSTPSSVLLDMILTQETLETVVPYEDEALVLVLNEGLEVTASVPERV